MKKILLAALSVVLIGGLLTTTSCKKGDQGPKGDSAIANVYYSNWISVPAAKWTLGDDSTYIFSQLLNSKIDTSFLRKGLIQVYWNAGTAAAPVIYPLPYRAEDIYIDYVGYPGGIELSTNTNAGISEYIGTGRGYYRYLLLTGSVLTGARTSGAPVDLKDYNAVKAYYGIKD